VGFVSIGRVFTFARDTQDLYALQSKLKDTLVGIDGRLRVIEDRLTRLESDSGQTIAEAKSAATAAATMIAGGVISDAVTRVTRMEEAIRRIERGGIHLDGSRVGDRAIGH
jgi:hypothetical protein